MKSFTVFFLASLALPVLSTAKPSSPAPTLKGAAAAAGLRWFGAALGVGHLTNASDPKFAELAAQQFSGATPENEMKWEDIEPFPGVFNFTGGDFIVDFAETNHYTTVRGHNLVWHEQLAPYVSNLTGNAVKEAMVSHIIGVVSHYKDRVYSWDVVNEPLNDNGTLGASPFLTAIGPDYIPLAYATARNTYPFVKLYVNDYNIEGPNNKSDAMLALVKDLKKQGIIDGVGFESHFIVGELPSGIQENIQRFVDAGVEVAITELDIRMTLPPTQADIVQQTADYTTVVSACKAVKGCVGITTWGITDLYSWIPGSFPGEGYALLWDDNYNIKPAYNATIENLT